MMIINGALGLQRSCGATVLVCSDRSSCLKSDLHRVAKGQGKGFLLLLLASLAACLAAGFVTWMVLEPSDLDSDLRQVGSGDFGIATQVQPVTCSRSADGFGSLDVIQCFVMAGGAHLVWRRPRARSDLVNASPLVSSVLNVAEPGWSYLFNGCPGARPFRFLDPGDGCNSRGRARAKDKGPLSGALSFISWFSSQADFSIFREARMLSGTATAPNPSEMRLTLAGDGVPCRAGSGDSFRRVAWTSAGGRR